MPALAGDDDEEGGGDERETALIMRGRFAVSAAWFGKWFSDSWLGNISPACLLGNAMVCGDGVIGLCPAPVVKDVDCRVSVGMACFCETVGSSEVIP